MIFTLEALQAREGDALLLHYGREEAPELIIIDGGPSRTYRQYLRKRLDEIRSQRPNPVEALPVRMLMLSHVDDDHIVGVLDLIKDLAERAERPPEVPGHPRAPYKIQTLWFNSFGDVVGKSEAELVAMSAALAGGPQAAQALSDALPVSLANGRELRRRAAALHIILNDGFASSPQLVVAPSEGGKQVQLDSHLTFTVVGPREDRIGRLKQMWDTYTARLREADSDAGRAEVAEAIALSTAGRDTSPYNLSSIVVLAEVGGKRMLLTGDALGQDIIEGLERGGLLRDGRIHVDLLKLPHHGSDRNVSPDFFRTIKAEHYVISADGKHENPSIPTLKWLLESRADDAERFKIYLTNDDSITEPERAAEQMRRVVEYLAGAEGNGDRYEVIYRSRNAPSLRVNLLSQLKF